MSTCLDAWQVHRARERATGELVALKHMYLQVAWGGGGIAAAAMF